MQSLLQGRMYCLVISIVLNENVAGVMWRSAQPRGHCFLTMTLTALRIFASVNTRSRIARHSSHPTPSSLIEKYSSVACTTHIFHLPLFEHVSQDLGHGVEQFQQQRPAFG